MNDTSVYLDSWCFIEAAKSKLGDSTRCSAEDLWAINSLLNASLDGKIKVYTSMMALVECLHCGKRYDEEVQDLFRRLLTSGGSGVTLVQTDIFVCERARDLRWSDHIHLTPIDSVHVASALEMECREFLTPDGSGRGKSKEKSPHLHQAALAELGLFVRLPRDSRCIPPEYRQHKLHIDSADGDTAGSPFA